MNKWEKYKAISKFLLINSLSSNDSLGVAKAYRSLGNYFYENRVLDSSYFFYLKSVKIYKKERDYDSYSTILLKKGIIQYRVNDLLGADLSLTNAYFISNTTIIIT